MTQNPQTPGETRKPVLWIDADALPDALKAIIIRAATRLTLKAIFVANKTIKVPRGPLLETIQVQKGIDIADNLIVDRVEIGDIVLTADIPLAAAVIAKGTIVIDPRGDILTTQNVRERLSVRNFMSDMRGAGTVTGGPRPFDERAKQKFSDSLDRILTARLKGH